MKRIYKLGALATFVWLTIQNIRDLTAMKRRGDLANNYDIAVVFLIGQLVVALASLIWVVSIPIYLLDNRGK